VKENGVQQYMIETCL